MTRAHLVIPLLFACSSAPPPPKADPKPRLHRIARPSVPTVDLTMRSEAEQADLPNGLRLIVQPRHGIAITNVSLVLFGGASEDGSRHGEAMLSHSTWLGRNAHEANAALAEYLVESGSEFGMSVEPDHVHVSIVGAEDNIEEMIEFIAGARNVKIDEDTFERRRNGLADELWELKRNPVRRAHFELPGLAFGRSHPYGHPPLGRRPELGQVTVSKAQAHLRRSLCPNRAAIVVSGPFHLTTVQPLVNRYFRGWRKCRRARPRALTAKSPPKAQVRIVHDPDRAQVVIVGGLGLSGLTADEATALHYGSEILGGTMASRLPRRLRGESGLTYGVHTMAEVYRDGGMLILHTAVDPRRVQLALEEILAGIEDLAVRPPTADEIARVQQRRAAEIVATSRSPDAFAAWTVQRLAADLPLEPSPPPSVERLAEFAKNRLRKDSLQIVLVGDARALRPIVEQAGLGRARLVQ